MDRATMNVRRVTGGFALLGALILLIAGETFLKSHLRDAVYILYWLACLILTTIAIIAAFLDVRSLQRRTRHEQKVLIEEAFKEIGGKRPKSDEDE